MNKEELLKQVLDVPNNASCHISPDGNKQGFYLIFKWFEKDEEWVHYTKI